MNRFIRPGQVKRKKSPIFFVILIIVGFFVIKSAIVNNKPAESEEFSKFLGVEVTQEEEISNSHSVCLDAGHGGVDQGGNNKKIIEKEIDLTVALKMQTILEDKGYKVYMTRTSDQSLSKQDRYNYCNNTKAEIMVAIHHNSYTDPTVNYSSSLYYTEFDQVLASSIVSGVSNRLGIKNGGVAKLNSRILSKADMPATISEAFFMSSSEEYNLLTKAGSTRLKDEAQGIVDGIINYFENPDSIEPVINNDQIIPADEE